MMKKLPYLALALGVFIVDQLSKWAVMEHILRPALGEEYGISRPLLLWLKSAPEILPYVQVPVLPFFNWVMVWNKGVSFGILNHDTDYGPLFLSVLALVIVIAFTIWLFRNRNVFQCVAIALVIGGAIGNVMDRIRFGAVVDFLDFHAFGWHWPAFNVSDSCICIGVFLLIIHTFFFEKKQNNAT
jgi:signal peptidase II